MQKLFTKKDYAHPQPQEYQVRGLIMILAILLCIVFFPYLFGGNTFLPSDMIDTMTSPFNQEYGPPQAQNHYPFDGLAQTYPYKVMTQDALKKGTFAYWNPHIFGGYPQYAESMGNNYDICNVLLLFFSPLDAIKFITILELFISGIGMLLLLRYFGIGKISNLIFASGYMLNSLFITSASHRWIIASFCWMPFTALMICRYLNSQNKKHALIAAIFLALSFLGGNFQTSFFCLFIVIILTAFYSSEIIKISCFERLKILTFISIFAVLLSFVMWLPTLELLFQSIFGGGALYSTSMPGNYSVLGRIVSFPLLICFLLPTITGSPQIYSIKYLLGPDMMNFNGAIGFLPGIFAFWGCFVFWRSKIIRPFIIIAAIGILLPIATPMYNFLYHRFFIVTSFSLSIIGAFTFQSFLDNVETKQLFTFFFHWIKLFFIVLFLILIGICIFILIKHDTLYSFLVRNMYSSFVRGNESWLLARAEKTLSFYSFYSTALWIPILAAAISIIAAYKYFNNKLSQSYFLRIIFFLSAIQLIIFARMWLPSVNTSEFPVYPRNPITNYIQQDSTNSRYYSWRDYSIDPYIVLQNSSNVYKINDIQGYETCTNRSLHVLYKKYISTDSIDLRLLGLFNVKYIIVGKRKIIPSNLHYLFSADNLTIYENPLYKPRAYFAYNTIIAEDDTVESQSILNRNFDGSKALLLRKDTSRDIQGLTQGINSIHFDKSENEYVEISAETDTKGIFILTDTYYPGWKCYVNGIEKPIYQVNYCMRGVVLEPGISKVVFKFEPIVFTIGAGISGITALSLLGTLFFLRRKEKRNHN
jgi:hypothetical protein